MDKALELRVIEIGFNPKTAREVSMQDAGNLVRENIYPDSRENPAGLILFDGHAQAIVRSGLGHTIINPSVAISSGDGGRGGLFVYSPESDAEGKRASVYVEKDGNYFVVVPQRESFQSLNGLDLQVQGENGNKGTAKVELFKGDNTKVLYLQRADMVEGDKLFWQAVAERFGLKLKEIEPQYTDKSPLTAWYSTKDEKTGTDLTLGTRFRVYAVRAKFPNERTDSDLKALVEGLNVNPQTVDGNWVGDNVSRGGRQFETHIYRGRGDQVVAYMTRLLERHGHKTA